MKVVPFAAREARRLQAWKLHRQGWSQRAIAALLEVGESTVSQWFQRARLAGGAKGLHRRKAPGAARRLPRACWRELRALLRRGAEAHGFHGALWTRERLAVLIRHHFGVAYSPRCVERHFVSAPVQFDAVPNPALINLDKELLDGNVVRIDQRFYWPQRVVYTGIDVTRIGRVDATNGAFTADFYLWFRYTGSDDVLNIDLNAATEKSPYDPKTPLEAKEIGGIKYRLYRVQGEFKSTFDFHDYPFDQQSLRLRLPFSSLSCLFNSKSQHLASLTNATWQDESPGF